LQLESPLPPDVAPVALGINFEAVHHAAYHILTQSNNMHT